VCRPTTTELRLADMDRDGIDATVMYGPIVPLFIKDPDLRRVCYRAYNDWLAEYCAYAPKQLAGLALISLWDIDEAVKELRRCRQIGLKGAMIWASPPEDRPYSAPLYEPFWAAAQDAHLTVVFHGSFGNRMPGFAASRGYTNMFFSHMVCHPFEQMAAMLDTICGGVLERFPRLRVGFFEAGADWLPYWTERMDQYWHASSWLAPGHPRSARQPSEYLATGRVYVTCEGEERLLPQVLEFLGEDRVMISGDMPHLEAREGVVAEIRERTDVSEAVKAKLLSSNAATFFRI
jgi:predicted TIM-barrel fold metal-dependent hydrolase